MKQQDLFNAAEPNTLSIDDSAEYFGVSTATIRNWVKTKYLQTTSNGSITLESIKQFQLEVSGKDKLTHRANKSLKDSHDHIQTTSYFLNLISAQKHPLDSIGDKYESSLSDSYRNKEGIYYTPNDIVNDLFRMPDHDVQDALFCDPCCGSGNFILRAIDLGFKPDNVFGFDTDPVAVELTKHRILNHTGYNSNNILNCDFLDLALNKSDYKFDYIYTNPPWGKKINIKRRRIIGSRLGAGASIDTCSLFFFACIKYLKTNGVLGLLLPESFFNIAIFEDARIKSLDLSIDRIVDYGKAFNNLVSKAHAIVIRNTSSDSNKDVSCETENLHYTRSKKSFLVNPKSILNIYCNKEDSDVLSHIMDIPHITLKNNAKWGLGIVTGNNKKFIKTTPDNDHIPVYKGADIKPDGLRKASSFIPSDMSLYQQVAPQHLYLAKEKLIYKFISSNLCFYYDDRQRYMLNSANMLIPDENFPLSAKILCELLNSDFMNWVFSRIFNTHKILRSDLESLPIHSQFLNDLSFFDENTYLEHLGLGKLADGTYRIKRQNN